MKGKRVDDKGSNRNRGRKRFKPYQIELLEFRLRKRAEMQRSLGPMHALDHAACTVEGQESLWPAIVLQRVQTSLQPGLDEVYSHLGKRHADPLTILRALVMRRVKPRKPSVAILKAAAGPNGTISVSFAAGAAPSTAAKAVKSLLATRRRIIRELSLIAFSQSPGPDVEGSLAWYDENALLIIMRNSGASYKTMSEALAQTLWSGNRSIEGRLKRRLSDLRKALGPSIVRSFT